MWHRLRFKTHIMMEFFYFDFIFHYYWFPFRPYDFRSLIFCICQLFELLFLSFIYSFASFFRFRINSNLIYSGWWVKEFNFIYDCSLLSPCILKLNLISDDFILLFFIGFVLVVTCILVLYISVVIYLILYMLVGWYTYGMIFNFSKFLQFIVAMVKYLIIFFIKCINLQPTHY